MPLINLVNETKLRSIPFGNDKPDGGSSGQPFIKSDLPGITDSRPLNFKDYILRGGGPLTTKAITTDFFRYTKYFSGLNIDLQNVNLFNRNEELLSLVRSGDYLDNPDALAQVDRSDTLRSPIKDISYTNIDGIIFAGKQNLLARNSVFINDGLTRIDTMLGSVGSALGGAIGLHFVKEGLNPLKGLLGGYSTLGYGSAGYYSTTYKLDSEEVDTKITTQQLTERFDSSKNIIYTLPQNKLTTAYTAKILKSTSEDFNQNPLTSKSNLFDLFKIDKFDPNNLMKYTGGPGSVLGIGSTRIRMASGYGDIRDSTFSDNKKGDYKFTLNKIYNTSVATHQDLFDYRFNTFMPGGGTPNRKQITILGNIQDFRKRLVKKNDANIPYSDYSIIGFADVKEATSTGTFNRENDYGTNVNLISQVKPSEKVSGFNNLTTPPNVNNNTHPNLSTVHDILNATPDFVLGQKGIKKTQLGPYLNQDIVKFYFEIISNDYTSDTKNKILIFRAFLNSLSDNFKSEWNSYKYVGRAENFYKYSGFNRDGQLSFSVAALSRIEMPFLYKKLNVLASTTAPDYSSQGLMRGNIVRLSIGDYFNETPCIINSVTLTPNFEAGWEINRTLNGTLIKRPTKSFTTLDPSTTSKSTYNNYWDSLIKENSDGTVSSNVEGLNDLTKQGDDFFIGQLPKVIDVDISFTVLHDFAPQYIKQGYNESIDNMFINNKSFAND